mmetsp:Transcript_24987/g.36890  ORF Transcript_24987/g.36890 Transcript_24987/m.36890 type:complete len:220 (+) Transcript_24987:100-759(+)
MSAETTGGSQSLTQSQSQSSSASQESGNSSRMGIEVVVQNIVATISLGVTVDLEKVAKTVNNAEYSPRRFAAVIMRLREPRVTALVFKTGKMIVTGAKNVKDSETAGQKFVRIIQRCGFTTASFNDYKIQNISATVSMGFPIRLEGLLYAHANCCTYEPELFPGLVYRMTNPKVVLLIFVSGKVVLTGAKDKDSLLQAVTKIHPQLLTFRKHSIIMTMT